MSVKLEVLCVAKSIGCRFSSGAVVEETTGLRDEVKYCFFSSGAVDPVLLKDIT